MIICKIVIVSVNVSVTGWGILLVKGQGWEIFFILRTDIPATLLVLKYV